jgi:dihydroflavonol-4-reductase
MPGCPDLFLSVADARNLASLHMLAMTRPEAAGNRFIGGNDDGGVASIQMAKMIAKRSTIAGKVPTHKVPNIVVYFLSLFDKILRLITPELGQVSHTTNAKARTILGRQPGSTEESIMDTVDSLVK